MRAILSVVTCCIVLMTVSICDAQRQKTKNRRGRGVSAVPEHPQAVGESGIAWYTTWKTGLSEAQRSNRPIFFMSAATTCSGISGVF